MMVTFKFDNFIPPEFSDFLVFDDSTMNLDTPHAEVELIIDGQTKECVVINGNIHFKRVQELFVDGEHPQIILSGYFEFQVLIDNYHIAISDGRFDIGIGLSNFFRMLIYNFSNTCNARPPTLQPQPNSLLSGLQSGGFGA